MDGKTLGLFLSAVLIVICGVLVARGWLDVGTQSLLVGLFFGTGSGTAVGYAAGRSANKTP